MSVSPVMNGTNRLQRWCGTAPAVVRYIKLGEGGAWLDECLAQGLLKFADQVPHEIAAARNWEGAGTVYRAAGEATVSDRLREIRTFYEADERCLWVTFGRGRLWWAYAEAQVTAVAYGVRVRRTTAPWSCLDAGGRELRVQDLSTSLTQTASYRKTICAVSAEAYLLRRLNAEPDPLVARAEAITGDLENIAGELIAGLHWRDFEVLVDLIFARSGWRRVAAVGGSGQADSDLILEQAVTGERAFVQIKSKADPATLRDYQTRFEAHPGTDRFFFACHSPSPRLQAPADPRVKLWLRQELASQALKAGLLDWLLEKRR